MTPRPGISHPDHDALDEFDRRVGRMTAFGGMSRAEAEKRAAIIVSAKYGRHWERERHGRQAPQA